MISLTGTDSPTGTRSSRCFGVSAVAGDLGVSHCPRLGSLWSAADGQCPSSVNWVIVLEQGSGGPPRRGGVGPGTATRKGWPPGGQPFLTKTARGKDRNAVATGFPAHANRRRYPSARMVDLANGTGSGHRCAVAVNLSRLTLVNICPSSRCKAAGVPWSASGQRRRRVVNGLVDEFLVQLHGCIPALTTGCRCSLFVPPRRGSCEFRTMRGT